MKNSKAAFQKCINIHKHESEADLIMRSALTKLFEDTDDPKLIIKWKEILELLESATDRADDVADIIEGLIIEAS